MRKFKAIIIATILSTIYGFGQSEVTITIGYPDHESYFIYSIPPTDEHARFGGEYYFKVENTGSVNLIDWEINTIWKTLNSTWGVVEKTTINQSTGEIKLTGPNWDTDLLVGESFVLNGEWISTGSIEDWVDYLPRDISMSATSGNVNIVYDVNGEFVNGNYTVQKTQPITDDLKSYNDLKVVAYFPIFDAENAWCSLQKYGANIDQLRVQLYSITPDGVLRAGQDLPDGVDPVANIHYWYDYIDNLGVVDFCVNNNIELIPVVFNYNPEIGDFDQSAVHTMMTTPSLRAAHINDIISVLNDKPNYAGIDVDYESLMASDRDNYSAFIEDLAQEVHNNNKIITTAVHTKVGPGTWYGPQAQDYQRLGNAVDEILFMTYDLHWATSPTYNNPPPTAGCQATPDWMNDVAMFAISEIEEPSKIQLGLPFYGYRWKYLFENHTLNDPGIGLTYKDAQDLIEMYNISTSQINREPNGNEPYFNIQIDEVEWTCYYQDELSISYKLTALNEHDLRDYIGGIGIWRLGGESDAMWHALMQSLNQTPAIINENYECSNPNTNSFTEQNEINFSIYPNPANDILYLKYNDLANSKIRIFSIEGQLMFEENKSVKSIDLRTFKAGVYFISVQSNSQKHTYKFVKY